MAGKNEGCPGFHGASSGFCMKLLAGVFPGRLPGKHFFEASAERKGPPEFTDDVSGFVQGRDRKFQTVVKAFQKFFKLLLLDLCE